MQDTPSLITPTRPKLGIAHNENYLCVEWEGLVVFSYARRGNAIMAHFASGKDGLRFIKPAINDFVEWVFNEYEWCRMILANIDKTNQSVVRLVKKCGFDHVKYCKDTVIYGRAKCHQ